MRLINNFSLAATLLLCSSTTLSRSHLLPWREYSDYEKHFKKNLDKKKQPAPIKNGQLTKQTEKIIRAPGKKQSIIGLLEEIMNDSSMPNYFGAIGQVITTLNTVPTIQSPNSCYINNFSPDQKSNLLTAPISCIWGTQSLLHIVTLYNAIMTTDDDVSTDDLANAKANVQNIVANLFAPKYQLEIYFNALTAKNAFGSTPLHYAALSGDVDLLNQFRAILGDTDAAADNWAFVLGARTTPGTVFVKPAQAPKISVTNVWGLSPIHYAAANIDFDVAYNMLDGLRACEIITGLKSSNSFDKATPLHYAAARGNDSIISVSFFEEKNITAKDLTPIINAQDINKNSCLDYALLNKYSVASTLLSYLTPPIDPKTKQPVPFKTPPMTTTKLLNFVISSGAWGPKMVPFAGLLMPGYDVELTLGNYSTEDSVLPPL